MQWRAARPLTALMLAAVLALASVTMAVARGQPAGLHGVTLCTGAGMVTVTLDAQGNPAGPPLPCPDCIAALAASLPAPAAGVAAPLRRALRLAPPPAPAGLPAAVVVPGARGPPAPV